VKKQTIKDICIALIIIFGIFSVFLFWVYYSFRRSNFKTYINSMNTMAGQNYSVVINFSDYKKAINVPKEGIHYIFGECNGNGKSYRIYKNDFIKNDMIIFGEEFELAEFYWAFKIENGEITESWASAYPLKNEQLVPYIIKEQMRYMPLIKRFNYSKVIGYYNVTEGYPK